METTLELAKLETSHLEGALRMSQDAGWPHRVEDWAFVAGISHGFVGLEGDNVVATAMATPFGDVAMANLIIVDAKMRGKGIGRKIMDRAMQSVSPSAWQLVATQEGLPLYERMGFAATGEIRQHQGPVTSVAPTGDAIWAEACDMDAIRALDVAATGMDRSTLYDILAQEARFAVLRDGDTVTGFAAIRTFGRGQVIGPVAATSVDHAKSLISLIMSECEGQFLRIDTGSESGLAPWLTECGLAHAGGGVQMQLGERTNAPSGPQRVFALASQALG